MNKKGMSYFSIIILLTALMIGFAVQQNPNIDITDIKSKMVWEHVEFNSLESPDLSQALESYINGIGEALFSFLKWTMQISYENPEIPFKLLIYFIILSIFAPFIVSLVKLITIIFLLTKEHIQSKKEKNILKKLKGGKTNE